MSNPNEKVASIRAKLKFPSVASFVERYAPNVSTAGIFVKTPSPKPVGTRVKFEFLIADGTAVMRGLGQVAWVRETDLDDRPVGMGIKFVKLDAASREVLDRIIDFKHSIGGPPTPSRYSEVPPPHVPEGTDVGEDEDAGGEEPVPAAAAAEPPREEPAPAPPPKPALAPPPPPAAPADERPRAEAAPKKKHRQKAANVDMSAIDSMLADLAAPSVDTGRRRRKTGEHDAVAPRPVPAPAPAVAEPAPQKPAFQMPALTQPSAAELDAAELDLERALGETRSSEEEIRDELRDELEALEGRPPAVPREPPVAERAKGTDEIRSQIADEFNSGELVDLLEPEEQRNHLAAPGEPKGFAGAKEDSAPVRYAPGSTVSFMPPPPSEADSLEEDFESVLGGADANGDGEVSSPTAALDEDSGVTELGEDAVIAGVMEDDSASGQGDFDIVEESGEGGVLDDMIAEMARDSHEPQEPADLQLLEEEIVSDALDDLFDEGNAEQNAASMPVADAPETLPDDAVPPGLVRERAPRRPAPPPPPEAAEDAASKKKGFFGKLFGK